MTIGRSTILRFALLTFVLLGAAAESFAQSQPEPQTTKKPGITSRSEVVTVPAIVTNHAGVRITDLTQENFRVFENGQLQKIAFFHHIQGTPEPAAPQTLTPGNVVSNTPTAGAQSSAILVWDLLNSTITEQANGRERLITFLSAAPTLSEPVCIVAFDFNGVRLIHDFSRDPALLVEALKTMKGHRSDKDTPKTNPLETTFRNVQGWHSKSASRNAAAAQGRQDLLDSANMNQATSLSWRTWITLEALREIGEAYAGIPGRKSLIWATGGFPFDMGDASQFSNFERTLMPYYENTWRMLNRANVAVYPLDVEDLVNPAYVDAGTGQPLPQHFESPSSLSNLESFADATGGRLCDRQTTAINCFATANNDANDYYLIGFYETAGNSKPGWRKLTVKVDRPGVQVRSRSGFYARGAQDENTGRKEDIELALSSPLDFTALRVSVRLTTNTEVNGKKRIGFIFVIPPGAVTIDESDSNHVNLDFAALATNQDGAAIGSFSQNLSGHLKPENVAALQTQGAAYPGSIDLPSGNYSIRFVVRDNVSGQVGSASAAVKVP